MVILGLVVAAGLVMGLIAFRMSIGQPALGSATPVASLGPSNAPRPSAADQEATDQPPNDLPQSTEIPQNAEPTPPKAEPPEMQGPTSGDPPGTAAAEPSQPGAPAETAGDSIQ